MRDDSARMGVFDTYLGFGSEHGARAAAPPSPLDAPTARTAEADAGIACRHEAVCELPDRYPLACFKCQFRANAEAPQDPQSGRTRWPGRLSFVGADASEPIDRVRSLVPPEEVVPCRLVDLAAVPGSNLGLDTRAPECVGERIAWPRHAAPAGPEPLAPPAAVGEDQLEAVLLTSEARDHERALCTQGREIGREDGRRSIVYHIVHDGGAARLRAVR